MDLNSDLFPVTLEVRDQLTALLDAFPGPQLEALFKSLMTTVMNLELAQLKQATEIVRLRNQTTDLRANAMELHVQLIELRTELITNRTIRPKQSSEIDWMPDDD